MINRVIDGGRYSGPEVTSVQFRLIPDPTNSNGDFGDDSTTTSGFDSLRKFGDRSGNRGVCFDDDQQSMGTV